MSDLPTEMYQSAPYPAILDRLVGSLRAFPGWSFALMIQKKQWLGDGTSGLRFAITVRGVDSYYPEMTRSVVHSFIVPAATYNETSWRRWVFDRCMDVQSHELCEFFRLVEDDNDFEHGIGATKEVRPYAPHHGPGNDPYFVFEFGTRDEQRTRNDGSLA